jgi:hypothetical protein
MAADTSRAAWHDKREFAVRLHPEAGTARDLTAGLPNLLDAIDYAVDWLDHEDPARTHNLRLAIIEKRDGDGIEVWSYPPSQQPSAGQELVQRLGLNPATWQPHTDHHPAHKPAHRASTATQRTSSPPTQHGSAPTNLPAPTPSSQPHPEPYPDTRMTPPAASISGRQARRTASMTTAVSAAEPGHDNVGESQRPTMRAIRDGIGEITRLAWEDRASRVCLIVAVMSVWLTVTLTSPIFLLTLLAALSGVWVLHRLRPAASADPDDWI